MNQISQRKPEGVVLELDARRAKAMLNLDIDSNVLVSYPQEGGFTGVKPLIFMWAASSVVGAISEIYGEGFAYGAEAMAAYQAASRFGARIVLADRDILLTMQRTTADISAADLMDILPSALGGVHLAPSYSAPFLLQAKLAWAALRKDWDGMGECLQDLVDDSDANHALYASSQAGRTFRTWNGLMIGLIKSGQINAAGKSALGSSLQRALNLLDEMPELLAELPKAITEERDVLLAHAIRNTPGATVVAVVGRGHLEGIARHWDGLASAPPEAVAHLLQPPYPYFGARLVGTYAVGGFAAIAVGRTLWRYSKPAFGCYVGAGCALLGTGALLAQRVKDVQHRVKYALMKAEAG